MCCKCKVFKRTLKLETSDLSENLTLLLMKKVTQGSAKTGDIKSTNQD